MFLWQQGKFKRFLELVKSEDKNGYNSYFEAAMEMPADKIVPLWKAYLNDIAANRNEIMRLPPSAIFQDKEVFQRFVTQYRIPTVKQRL